jgi:chromosome segregation ATPase
MKRYMVILLIPFFFACGRAAKEKAAELQAKNDSLMSQTALKDGAISDFMKSVGDIQGVLDSIKTKENIISMSAQAGGEMKLSMRNQIRSDILSIYSLMLKDKQQLDVLTGKLKRSGLKIDGFQKLVDHLQREIAEKDSSLAVLNDKMKKMDIAITDANHKIDTLDKVVQNQGQEINGQKQVINDQTTSLNTAYYVLGTPKKLKEEKIIKGSKLLTDFNKSYFTKVDIRNLKEIPISGENKKVKLLTNHPSSSYRLQTEGKIVKSLVVTNEKDFWSTSKYLVMVAD